MIPQSDGSYISRAAGPTPDNALGRTINTARITCEKQGKRHVVVSSDSEYIGAYGDKNTRDFVEGMRAGQAAATRTAYQPNNGYADYRSILKFNCAQ